MRDIILSHIEGYLKTGQVQKSLTVMRDWLSAVEPGEPELLLAEASEAIRPKIALLLRDLLSRYPSTLVGAPMLVMAAPDFEDTQSRWARSLALPFPAPEVSSPCAELHFLGWLAAETPLPVDLPFQPARHSVEVPWLKPTSVVALFRSHPGLFDLDTVDLPSQWWGRLFQPVSANIHLSARLLLPYPDALEAARLLQACVRDEPWPAKGYFLSDSAWSLARDEAMLFHETCRRLFRQEPG